MNIKFFKDIQEKDIVGGKGASLSKMWKNGFNVPNGYVIQADLFNEFLIQNNIKDTIQNLINKCNVKDEEEIKIISNEIMGILNNCKISKLTENKIIDCYEKLNGKYVAVRSSATSEDGKSNAWAGQLDTFLNVNKTNIIDCVKKCWFSIFSPRALFYRIKNKDMSEISVAVVVQKMIQSDISGIAFSINPTNNTDEIVIESVLGLGEAIVSGKVTPDTYIVNKEKNKIDSKEIKIQKSKLVKEKDKNKWISIENGNRQKLDDEKILKLSNIIKKIENFYGFPVDVEWGVEDDEIYILQSRPVTTVKKNELLEKIKKVGNWNFYVARKFNWFVENTEIYSTLEKYQKELLGFELAIQNYLCLNGDEYSSDSNLKVLCDKLDNYFEKDINFFEKFAKIEFDIVERVKKYLEYLENKNLSILSFEELAKEVESFNDLYIKSFIPGMTRPEEYLTKRLNEELIELKFTKEDIDIIFSKISTCPNYFPLSYSEEPLDLLKIALVAKKGKDITELLDKHIKKYSWIKGPLEFENTVFTKEDYLERLENLKNEDIEEKIDIINNVRKNNEIEYEETLKKYPFSQKAKKLIKAIRDFIFLRTYTTEYSDNLFFASRNTIFKEISSRTNITEEDLIMLNDKEILDIIRNKGIMNEEIKSILEKRKKGFAIIWINGEVQTVFGDESLKLQNETAETYKILQEEEILDKKVISGSIANRGRVRGTARILNTYNDIYKVKKGDIIVTTMTTPDYVSAMEKAAGFITDEGGITCHAAIISREFNVPCIVGTVNATKEIKDGEIIELDAYNGKIYKLV